MGQNFNIELHSLSPDFNCPLFTLIINRVHWKANFYAVQKYYKLNTVTEYDPTVGSLDLQMFRDSID